MNLLGVFVNATLRGGDECRQGVVICLEPLQIRGQSGQEYLCEGMLTVVSNPPEEYVECGGKSDVQ